MASTSWVVAQSQQALKQRINSHSKQKLIDNINSKDILPRTLHFVKPKKQQNARPMTSHSSSSTPPPTGRQRSDFNCASQQLFDEANIPQLMQWKKSANSVGSGLRNLGNSCFMNATLQCLCYTAPFQNYITTRHHTKNCKTNGYCVFCELQKLMPTMLRSQTIPAPRIIFKNLRLLSKKLRPGRQEDAQEFLRFLMEGLQNNCLKQQGIKISDMRVQETTFIHKLWGGYLRSQIKCCKCGYESNTYDSILDISLEIKGPSVRSAFKHFTDPEILDDDNKYQCDNCKKKRRAIKQFTIFEPPNIFVIHLKRFESGGNGLFSGGKINSHIKFEVMLDITEYMSYQTCPKVSYSLFGVLVHYGYSSHGGHYVSYIKSPNGDWYLMDDARSQCVTSVNAVLKEKAYLLFYQRNEHKVLYKSPAQSPNIIANKKSSNIASNDIKKRISISSFDSLQELANLLPKNAPMFKKGINTQTITESPKSSTRGSKININTNDTNNSTKFYPYTKSKSSHSISPKPTATLRRNTKPLIKKNDSKSMSMDTISSSHDVDMKSRRRSNHKKVSDAFEWQQNTNCGEKRKLSLGDKVEGNTVKSPPKKRKLNGNNNRRTCMNQLELLKLKLSLNSSESQSSQSSSPSLNKYYSNIHNMIYGRRSHALQLAAKTRLRTSPTKIWNKQWKRASQIPTSSIHNAHKWKRPSPPAILSDSSSESVLSDNKAISFCDDSSDSTSPHIFISPKASINTRLPPHDGTSPHTLPIRSKTSIIPKTILPQIRNTNITNVKHIHNVSKRKITSNNLISMINDQDVIDKYLNDDASIMSAIGVANIGTWTSQNANTTYAQNVRDNIIRDSNQPIVSAKDEWDLALDTGIAYPRKQKKPSEPFKNFNRKQYVNMFQSKQMNEQNGMNTTKKIKKKKGSFHNKNRFHNRRRKIGIGT